MRGPLGRSAAQRSGARRAGRPARVHLKIDTGLSRNGCAPADWADLLDDTEEARRAGEVVPVPLGAVGAGRDLERHARGGEGALRPDDPLRDPEFIRTINAAYDLGGPSSYPQNAPISAFQLT